MFFCPQNGRRFVFVREPGAFESGGVGEEEEEKKKARTSYARSREVRATWPGDVQSRPEEVKSGAFSWRLGRQAVVESASCVN